MHSRCGADDPPEGTCGGAAGVSDQSGAQGELHWGMLRHALMRAPTPGAALELLQRAEAAVQGNTSGQL